MQHVNIRHRPELYNLLHNVQWGVKIQAYIENNPTQNRALLSTTLGNG